MANAEIWKPRLLVLEENWRLRMITLFVLYLNQGVAPGFFVFAVPAWLAANGATTAEIASVVSASALPWSLKFINGFLVDRYTFLPMGRRRAWIIGAQLMLVAALLLAAALSPSPDAIVVLAGLGFAANLAVNFQDVGIDALAIDIMDEPERAHAAGVMFGAQIFGIALTTAMAGWILDSGGIASALGVVAIVPAAGAAYALAVIERRGERHVPWGKGDVHPANEGLRTTAWLPLLSGAMRALFTPLSLAFVPVLLVRAIPSGAFEAFHPQLFTGRAGWAMTSYTELVAAGALAVGAYAILCAGRIAQHMGARRTLALCAAGLAATVATFGALPGMWAETWFLVGFVLLCEVLILTYAVALIPIAMRLCVPAVAATQFVIYMGLGQLGRPAGALLASVTAGAGHPEWMYFIVSAVMLAVSGWALFARSLDEGSGDTQTGDAKTKAPARAS